MRTIHQYLRAYPISKSCKKLILGTIHPHDFHLFKLPFFYGNKLSIWNILNEAFDFQVGDPISVESILSFLNSKRIAISDTIVQCSRKNPTALDKDLIPEILNLDLINQIRYSSIDEIFFTSGFGKNNAFKLFYENILELKITKEIRENKQVTVGNEHFGRPIKLIVLISPSGSANGSISKSKGYLSVKKNYEKFSKPVKQYRIDFYKEKFTDDIHI